MKDKEGEYGVAIIIAILLVITIGNIQGCVSYHYKRDNACKLCGYTKATDYSEKKGNPITLTHIECDKENIISLYDGYYSTDKWGDRIVIKEDRIICGWNYANEYEIQGETKS